jgi:hypothetical protein
MESTSVDKTTRELLEGIKKPPSAAERSEFLNIFNSKLKMNDFKQDDDSGQLLSLKSAAEPKSRK